VNLILLSATIDAPEMFGKWLGELKQKPIHLISTEYRIVPLIHGVYKGDEFLPIMDHRDMFDAGAYNTWLRWNSQQEKAQVQHRQRVDDRRRGGYEDAVISGGSSKKSFIHEMNGMIARMADTDLLPAIFFVFSRKDCERYAGSVEHSLLDGPDIAAMHHIMDFHLHRYGEPLKQMQQYNALRALLDKGVAYHHSGLLPVLKEIVEILFGRGYIKVLFATETFAVGINMPTKSVVFTGFRKYDDSKEGMRLLTTDEYIQMAGRAGRRGKDVRGNVIYLPCREPESVETMRTMMTGSQTTFQSRMTFYYDFLLKTLHAGNTRWIEIMKQSYWSRKQQQKVEGCEQELAACIQEKQQLGLTAEQIADMKQLDLITAALKSSGNAERKKVQRELETWKQRHMGPVWWKIEKELWKKYSVAEREEAAIQKDIEFLQTGSQMRVETTLNALREYGFLGEEGLTPLGVLASEVNEGHPILMPLFYSQSRELLRTREELLTFLAFFIPGEEGHGCSLLPEARKVLVGLADKCMDVEKRNGIVSPKPGYWSVHTGNVEMIWRLVNGETIAQLCYDYEIFEGNIMRILSSMLHLLEEWRNMATLSNDTRTLEMLVDAELCITSGSIGDSIYLRL
jgi:superfamily II RNA helicase